MAQTLNQDEEILSLKTRIGALQDLHEALLAKVGALEELHSSLQLLKEAQLQKKSLRKATQPQSSPKVASTQQLQPAAEKKIKPARQKIEKKKDLKIKEKRNISYSDLLELMDPLKANLIRRYMHIGLGDKTSGQLSSILLFLYTSKSVPKADLCDELSLTNSILNRLVILLKQESLIGSVSIKGDLQYSITNQGIQTINKLMDLHRIKPTLN